MRVKSIKIKRATEKMVVSDCCVGSGLVAGGHASLPDIDIDFASDRRAEIKAYLEERYNHDGKQRVFSAGTFVSLQLKAVLSDVARVHKIPIKEVKEITAILPDDIKDWEGLFRFAFLNSDGRKKTSRVKAFIHKYPRVIEDIRVIMGQPKSPGIHASAVIVTPDTKNGVDMECFDFVPIRKVDGLLVSELDGYKIESLGLLKNDILATKELSKLSKTIDIINKTYNKNYSIENISEFELDDDKTYKLFADGHTQNIFQFGSKGMVKFMKNMNPDNIEDLIAGNALFRPATLEIGATDEYCAYKRGEKVPVYDYGTYDATHNTFGIMCIAEDSLVTTSTGDKKIQDVAVGDMVLTEDGTYHTVTANIKKGVKQTIRVRTSHGEELVCTSDHKVLTQNGWVEAGDLNKNVHYIKGFWTADRSNNIGNDDDWSYGYSYAKKERNDFPEVITLRFLSGLIKGNNYKYIGVETKEIAYLLYKAMQSFDIPSSYYVSLDNKYVVQYDEYAGVVINSSNIELFIKYLLENNRSEVWTDIVSIEDDSERMTYDLSVDTNHSFVVGGLVVHNCYQEQFMNIAHKLAGFDLGKTDVLRKCVDEDSMFWTKNGYVRIKDLEAKTAVQVISPSESACKFNIVNRVLIPKKKECVKITTQSGRELVCTPDHRILTNNGWKEAGDLKGSYIIRELIEKYGTYTEDECITFITTALITEGSCGEERRGWKFTNKDTDMIEKYIQCLKQVGCNDYKVYVDSKGVCNVWCANKYLDFIKVKRVKSVGHELPFKYLSFNKHELLRCLGWMIDFDGFILSANGKIHYSSKSPKLIQQVQYMFDNLGVRSNISVKFNKEYQENYYEIYISDYADNKKIHGYLQDYSKKVKDFNFNERFPDTNQNTYSLYQVPFNVWNPTILDLIQQSGFSINELLGSDILGNIRKNNPLTHRRLRKILKIVGRNKWLEFVTTNQVLYDEVVSIESAGDRVTYDFSMCSGVDPIACVNGMIVHNCIGKKKLDLMATLKADFINGAIANGCPKDEAENIWHKIELAGKYSFNKCISGKERLYRPSTKKEVFKPTISEMYKIKNDRSYAASIGKIPLHAKYRRSYGTAFSLNKDNKLVINEIEDIVYQGCREVFRITLENGAALDVTDNHKHPTQRGKVRTDELVVGEDKMFFHLGHEECFHTSLTQLMTVVSVESIGTEDVYDVCMKAPNHTFVTDNGVATCNSHAAAYALTAFTGAWLKANYPTAFYTTALQFIDDKEIPGMMSEMTEISNARIVPPDINHSNIEFYTNYETDEIFWSLSRIKFVGAKAVEYIIKERESGGNFKSLRDFLLRTFTHKLTASKKANLTPEERETLLQMAEEKDKERTGVDSRVVKNMILAGCFDKIENIRSLVERYSLIKETESLLLSDWSAEFSEDEVTKHYFWSGKQIEISGIGAVDFKRIYESCSNAKFLKQKKFNYMEIKDMKDVLNEGKKVGFVGKLIEFKELSFPDKSTGRKKLFCKLRLQQNTEMIDAVIWSDKYEGADGYRGMIQKAVDKIVVLSGVLKYSSYSETNEINSGASTVFEIVD